MVTIHKHFFVLALMAVVAQRYRRTTKFCVQDFGASDRDPLLETTELAVLVSIDLMPVAFGKTAQLNSLIPGILV